MTYHSASCVVAGEDITNEEGKAVSEALLSAFGYTDFRFQPDEKRSKYYMPDSQTEVYARHPVHGWVEVATFGMYSPSALAEYGIGVPVMNLGLGVERLAMIAYQSDDVRQLCYPQFFPRASRVGRLHWAVRLGGAALTGGKELAAAIAATAAANAAAQGPCVFEAWEGPDRRHEGAGGGRGDRVHRETLRAGCANEIFVHDGSILGVPDAEKWKQVRTEGIPTGISYLTAVSALAAARIEEAARCRKPVTVQVKMAKLPSDINLKIDEYAMRFLTDNKKKVDVRGPVFLSVRFFDQGIISLFIEFFIGAVFFSLCVRYR